MEMTLRDTANFYKIALELSSLEFELASLADVVAWADLLITERDIPDDWMFDLSMAKDSYAAISVLSKVPPPETKHLGGRVFIAYVSRLWSLGAISFDNVIRVHWEVEDYVRPENEEAYYKVVMNVDLARSEMKENDPKPPAYANEAMTEFLDLFKEFGPLIPAVSLPSVD